MSTLGASNPLTPANKQVTVPVNPLVDKLWSVKTVEETSATYGGIYGKSLLFLLMTIVGVAMAFLFKAMGAITIDVAADDISCEKFVIVLLLAAAAIFVVFPFIAFLVRVTIPFTGSLYCVSVGYLFGFFALLDVELGSYIIMAFVLTLTLVAVMGFLFMKGLIHVSLKFRAITTTGFIVLVLGSLLLFGCSFVPGLREPIMHFTSNPVVYLLSSVGGLIVAILFLLVDFDNIRMIVEQQLPKKYEWYASFSLAFAVVWVYIKILHLILRATNKGS